MAEAETIDIYPPEDTWHKPQPIPTTLLNVQAFDAELLPPSLRGWVMDIAERMQCPPDFPAVGAMVALSSVIGRKACITPKRRDDWRVVPNLWGAVVGRPGVMKSPALAEVLRPLERLQIEAKEIHTEELREHEVSVRMDKLTVKNADRTAEKMIRDGKPLEAENLLRSVMEAEETPEPPLRRYRVNDSSVEALGEILIENPWGVLAYRDELHGLLRSLDREGQEGSRAFYLQGYDGNQAYTFDRIMRGRNLHIPAVCLAMLGGIQPGRLQSYIHDAVNGGSGDDGLLQRFGMIVWPDIEGEWINVDRWPDTPARQAAFEAFTVLDALQPAVDEGSGEEIPHTYRFDAEAQDMFDAWRTEFEQSLRNGETHPAVESHLAKYRKLVPALALVCAMAEGETDVNKVSLVRALAWSEYLRSHAERVYAAGTGPDTEGASALLKRILAGKVQDGFKPADVYLKGWAHLNSPEAAWAAAQMLCDLDYLKRVDTKPGPTGGRPSTTYRIHPEIIAKAGL